MLRKAISAALLALAMQAATADTLLIEGINPANADNWPARGATKSSVEARLGAPERRAGPVGQPPISSWDYGSFIVYFEYDRVLHTVAKR